MGCVNKLSAYLRNEFKRNGRIDGNVASNTESHERREHEEGVVIV
jgi:hypothetical protein